MQGNHFICFHEEGVRHRQTQPSTTLYYIFLSLYFLVLYSEKRILCPSLRYLLLSKLPFPGAALSLWSLATSQRNVYSV